MSFQGRKSDHHHSFTETEGTILADIGVSIHEWTKISANLLISGNMQEYNHQRNQISCLLEWRRQILAGGNTSQAVHFARNLIESRKQLDKSFSIPKTNDNQMISKLPLPHSLTLHRAMQDRLVLGSFIPSNVKEQYHFEEQHSLREIEVKDVGSQQVHLFLDMAASKIQAPFPFKLFFSIWKEGTGFITDEFYISLTKFGLTDELDLVTKLSTIFTDLQRDQESLEKLYVVCRAYVVATLGQDLHAEFTGDQIRRGNVNNDKGKEDIVQRPFGCGVVSFADLGFTIQSGKPLITKINMPLHCFRSGDEEEFHVLHKLIISKSVEVIRTRHELILILCVVTGDIHSLQDPPPPSAPSAAPPGPAPAPSSHDSKSPHSSSSKLTIGGQDYDLTKKLHESTITPRYSQPDIVDIRDIRDEIYVTIGSGKFSQDDKSTPRNIEITIRLFNEKGEMVTNCLSRGTGRQIKNKDVITTAVYYHNNEPSFYETFRIDLQQIPNVLTLHLLIEMAHCSSGQVTTMGYLRTTFGKKKKEGQLFAFTYLPLRERSTGVILSNGEHTLSTYNPPPNEDFQGDVVNTSYLHYSHLPKRLIKGGTTSVVTAAHTATAVEESLVVNVYVSSKKYTIRQEIHELFEWENITEPELNLTIANCLASDISDHLLTSILHTSLAIIANKPNLRHQAYQLFIKVIIQFYHKNYSTSSANASSPDRDLLATPEMADTLIFNMKKWIDSYFQTNPQLPLILLRCLFENFQFIEKNPSSTPSTSLFRKNLFQTSSIMLTLISAYIQQFHAQNEAILSEFTDLLSHLLTFLSGFHPSSPPLFALLRGIFFDLFHISCLYLKSETHMATILINFLTILHSPNYRNIVTVKNDKFQLIFKILNLNYLHDSLPYQERVLETILLIIQDQFLLDPYDPEPYGALFHLLTSFPGSGPSSPGSGSSSSSSSTGSFSFKSSQIIINSCIQLIPAFIIAIGILFDGKINEKYQNTIAFTRRRSIRTDLMSSTATSASSASSSSAAAPSPPHQGTGSNPLQLSVLENAICSLCHLLNLIGRDRFYQLIEMRNKIYDGKNLFLLLNSLFTLFLKRNIFPSTWLVLKISVMSHISEYLTWVSSYLDSKKDLFLAPNALSQYWAVFLLFPSIDIDLNIDPLPSSSDPHSPSHHMVNNMILWSSVLNLTLYLLLDPEISMELQAINPAKRAYLLENHSSFRDPIVTSLLLIWNSLRSSHLKLKFINLFTIPILALTCSIDSNLANCGQYLLTDILTCDYSHTQQFNLTSPHIYDCVCLSVLKNRSPIQLDTRYLPTVGAITHFLQQGLIELFEKSLTLNNKQSLDFALEMRNLLNLLLNLSEYPQNLEYEEERSFAYHKLMSFFSLIGRQDSFIKTTHHLAREMIQLENFLEGGNLIKLHINLLDWSDKILDSIDLGGGEEMNLGGGSGGLGILGSEKSYQRKISLIKYAIVIFEYGKAYEECISLLNELCDFYRHIQPNYQELVLVMSQQIDFYSKITTIDRYYPTMFRVGYYGQGVTNELIRNQEFIYKGAPLESIIDFSNRIKKKYPHYEILGSKLIPSDYFNSEKGYLQISKVTPVYPDNDNDKGGKGKGEGETKESDGMGEGIKEKAAISCSPSYPLPPYIQNYQLNQNLQYFYYQKPFRKREIKSKNEFLDLWVERKILKSEFSFPSISRRSLVVTSESIIYNPVEMAVQGLLERNQELRARNIEMNAIEDGQAGQSYTMTLSGTVDAAVNGGLSNYQCFFDGSYVIDNPEIAEDINSTPHKQGILQQLRDCLQDQLQLLDEGMKLHERKCLVDMRPLHDHLFKRFQEMEKKLTSLLETK